MSSAPRPGRARKLRLLSAFVKRRPVWCSWQVTRRCASLCQFCEHRAEGGDPDPSLAACLEIVRALDAAGTLMVSLTGGDPLLRSDLPEIVAALARQHYPHVTTHGWLVTGVRARGLWEAGLEGASVLLHHPEAGRHDDHVGLPGSHQRALEAASTLAETRTQPGQQVNLKVRFEPQAFEALDALLAWAAPRRVSVSVEPGFPLPMDAGAPAGWGARLLALKRRHAHLRNTPAFLARLPEALRAGVPSCQAGRAFLNVDHRGQASKCIEFTRPEDAAGALGSEGWQAVLPRLRRQHEQNRCQACYYASRGEVENLYSLRGLAAALPAWVRA
jgi:MoaA/NifB/PqqE/SkfB family radical SAM enzyme